MKRREFLKAAAMGVSSAAVSSAFAAKSGRNKAVEKMIKGRVILGGRNNKPLSGVVITDGLVCVRTDENGNFSIPERKGAKFLSVTTPSGYRCEEPFLPLPRKWGGYQFVLRRWKPSAGKGCTFVHLADSETTRVDWMQDVKRVADEENAAFIVHTGDICRHACMRTHLLSLNSITMGRPVVYCIGNHDMEVGPSGESYFESLFGPVWHSFEAGGVHFVVTPMPSGDYRPSYSMDEVADWVRNDLAMVPKGMPVVFFNHMLSNWHEESLETCGFTIGRKRRLNIAEACNFTGFVYGHQHVNYFTRRGNAAFICSAPPCMGGIALHPATLRTIRADENGRLDSKIRYGTSALTIPSKAGAVWETKLPGKVLFSTPVVEGGRVFTGTSDDEGCGNASVTALDAATGKIVWSQPMPNSVNNKMVFAKGFIIAQDIEGRVRAFSPENGAIVWSYEPPVHPSRILFNGLSYDDSTGFVFSGIGKRMVALDAASGKAVWKDAGWKSDSEACADTSNVGEGVVVTSGNWNGMFCNDAATGKLLWSGIDGIRRFPGATPLIRDGRIHTVAASSYLEVDVKTGKILREKRLPDKLQVTTRVLITDKHFIFGSALGGLYALDKKTLEVAWRGEVGPALAPFAAYTYLPQRCVGTAPFLLPDGTVCATASDGAIHFWRESDGKHVKEYKTGAAYFADAVMKDDLIIAADSAGYVRAFKV